MAYTKNAVMEIYEDGTAAVIDTTGCVRIVPDLSYEEGQTVWLDVEALDIAEAAFSEEATERALAGDFDDPDESAMKRLKKGLAKRAFPIAASFALALIFGVGGSVYANGEVAQTMEMDDVTYELNYFNRVIGVRMEDADEEMLFELKREIRGRRIEDATEITEVKRREGKLPAPAEKEQVVPEEIDEKEEITDVTEDQPQVTEEDLFEDEFEENAPEKQDNSDEDRPDRQETPGQRPDDQMQERPGQDKGEQNMAEQDKPEQNRSEKNRPEQDKQVQEKPQQDKEKLQQEGTEENVPRQNEDLKQDGAADGDDRQIQDDSNSMQRPEDSDNMHRSEGGNDRQPSYGTMPDQTELRNNAPDHPQPEGNMSDQNAPGQNDQW
ncbi:MAG: hypothetical protein K6B14_09380 [Lachnospiraceae bacterium]|nr:hypothetical protein [Lachnospiraceae bacterium]